MTPFFTIITVSLNAGLYLYKTIDSVLQQDFQDFNIIVKDGVSSDGSYEQILPNNKILKVQKEDHGIYDAMNQALEYANGEYILFLNAGDYFYDTSVLSSFYKEIQSNNSPGIVYCDYKTTDLDVYIQSPSKLSSFFLFRTMLCHQVCMIKRELYISYGNFDTNYKVDADYDFLIRLIVVNKNSYKHFKKLGVISTSRGFSFQNRDIAKQEVELIRRKYFQDFYFIYNLLLKSTMPNLREKIVNNGGFLSKMYYLFVNMINRL